MTMPEEKVDRFSALQLKNDKFKKVVWITSFLSHGWPLGFGRERKTILISASDRGNR